MEATERGGRGFTLLELMFVCLLLGVVLAAAYAVISAVSLSSDNMSARVVATDESQTFIDRAEGELRPTA
jgi:prepilin-type N-terminal cleavage/methylation domain-containing protein